MKRTKWPTKKFADVPKMIQALTEFYDLYALLGDKPIYELLRRLKGSGWGPDAIKQAQDTAVRKSNWSQDKYIEERMESNGLKCLAMKSDRITQRRGPKRFKKERRKRKCTICEIPVGKKRWWLVWGHIGIRICVFCRKRLEAKMKGEGK